MPLALFYEVSRGLIGMITADSLPSRLPGSGLGKLCQVWSSAWISDVAPSISTNPPHVNENGEIKTCTQRATAAFVMGSLSPADFRLSAMCAQHSCPFRTLVYGTCGVWRSVAQPSTTKYYRFFYLGLDCATHNTNTQPQRESQGYSGKQTRLQHDSLCCASERRK